MTPISINKLWSRSFLQNSRRVVDHPELIYWMIVIFWVLYSCMPFWSIGMATQDQIDFSMKGLTDGYLSGALSEAKGQGRVYFIYTKIIDLWLSAHPDLFITKLFTVSSFLLGPLCFSYAFFTLMAHRLLFIWLYFSIVWVGFYHLPPAAYPIINDAPFILWAIAAWVIRNAESAPRLSIGLVFVVASMSFFQYEPITLMSLLFFSWVLFISLIKKELKMRLLFSVAVAALLYVFAYLYWREIYTPGYDGNQFGDLSVIIIIKTFISFTLGSLPQFGMEVPLVWGDAIVGKSALRMMPPVPDFYLNDTVLFQIGFTILAGLSFYRLIFRRLAAGIDISDSNNRGCQDIISKKHSYTFATVTAVGMLVSANMLISLSAKYQGWVEGFSSPYLTGRLALLPLVALGVIIFHVVSNKMPASTKAVYWMVIFGVVGAMSVWVHSHNLLITPRLRANLTKWDAASALAQCTDQSISRFAVPALFYSTYASQSDWGGYWARFFKYRYSRDVEIVAHRPKNAEFAMVTLHHAGDGSLQGLTVDLGGSLLFISESPPLAMTLFAGGSEGWPIAEEEARQCGTGSYMKWEFSHAATEVITPEKLELVNAIPKGDARAKEEYSEFAVSMGEIRPALNMLYLLYFGRKADPGGLDYWSGFVENSRGNLYRPLQEFERIKGASTIGKDVEVVTDVLSDVLENSSLEHRYVLEKAQFLPVFGRRWLLFKELFTFAAAK